MGRRRAISVFVIGWLLVFNYETLRHSYLDRWLGLELPKVKFLFPPAGWIMFYRVDDSEGRAEVWGIRAGRPELVDPHRIFATRWVGYDNIRRNVLVTALNIPGLRPIGDPVYAWVARNRFNLWHRSQACRDNACAPREERHTDT